MSRPIRLLSSLVAVLVLSTSTVHADDWNRWLGPEGDSTWREEGIVSSFPQEGLTVKWRTPVAGGYSGPAVVGNRVYVTDFKLASGSITNNPGQRDALEGEERVLCLDATSGEVLWTHAEPRKYSISYPAGPRCMPIVDGGRVYVMGAEGDLLCLSTDKGEVVWRKQLRDEYSVPTPIWGFSTHPLIDGDRLICIVGGQGTTAVAFDKKTGKELWRALSSSEPGYSAPMIVEREGTRQVIIWSADNINGLDPETGKVHWSVPLKPQYGMSIMVPREADGYLFASGIGKVGALLKLTTEPLGAEVVWKAGPKDALFAANVTPVIEDGIMYGADCRPGAFRAVRLSDGERLWETFEPTTGNRRAGHGTAFVVRHANGYFLFSETGDLILARLSPRGYEEISRFHAVDPSQTIFGRQVVWTHPAFANRCVYIRNDQEIVCISLAEK